VVAFDVNYGPADMIEDGENGALVPFGNEDLLAQRIIEILGDPERHQRLCEQARRAAKQFRTVVVAEKWKSLIQDVFLTKPPAQNEVAMNIGQTLQMAHVAGQQIGCGRNVRIWFDGHDDTLSLSFTEGFRETLATEQFQALEAACRFLNLRIKDSPPDTDLSTFRSDRQDAETRRSGSDVSETFDRYYSQNTWGNSESVSGSGSTLAQTQTLRTVLPTLFSDLSVRSLLDLPCGDFHWMRHVPLENGIQYLGADVVEALVQRNQEQFGSERVRFIRLDVLCDRIPRVDLILCRDCLVHLPNADIRRALFNLSRSGSQWLLTTTFPGHHAAKDIALGKWRPLNLEAEPFCLPPPLMLVVERCTQGNGRFADKSLGLWHLRDIANGMGHDTARG
jgi:hypothetical protein